MLRRLLPLVLVLATVPLAGHVGTIDVFFEDAAGPYPIRVMVRPPGVVPGEAEITVRVLDGTADRVTVQPLAWDADPESGAPPPDVAVPVPGEAGLFSSSLWLMTSGSYSVRVEVSGPEGSGRGERARPVGGAGAARDARRAGRGPRRARAVPVRRAPDDHPFAAVRESGLGPDETPEPTRVRRAWIATAATAVLLVLVLTGAKTWWDAEERAYQNSIFEPLQTEGSVRVEDGQRILRIAITDPAWLNDEWTPLVPDHGKLIHLFAVREDGLGAFAHLHPVAVDSSTFEVVLPPFPAGRYRLYADVTHESGFAQTLTDTVAVPALPVGDIAEGARQPDADDSWTASTARLSRPPRRAPRPSRSPTARRCAGRPSPLVADAETSLVSSRSATRTANPPALEPYMGMLSHAAVTRDDGSVFVHLHPTGSISMAARRLYDQRADSTAGMDHERHVDASGDHSEMDHGAMSRAEPNVRRSRSRSPSRNPARTGSGCRSSARAGC